ncbi:hypothetical protein PCK1_003011 [Pneumocystis canis]|nr:hypothetical protein PCK1_003011 [Pneumocystis canis]
MEHWKSVKITQTNYPVLFPDEKILFIQSSASLYDPFFKENVSVDGTLYLTSHRICFIYPSESQIQSLGLNLSQIEKIGFFRSSHNITIYYKKIYPTNKLNTSDKTATDSKSHSPPLIKDSWICTVCNFRNPIPENYTTNQFLPPCLACGVFNNYLLNYSKPVSTTVSSYSKKDIPFFECQKYTFLNHPTLKQCESSGTQLISQEDNSILFNSEPSSKCKNSLSQRDPKDEYCILEFKSGGERLFYERLKEAINQKIWDIKSNSIKQSDIEENQKIGGISILQHAKENIRLNNSRILNHELSDLNTLMAKAKELIALANSLKLQLQTSAQTISLQELMIDHDLSNNLITKTVTKDDNIYYIELAKQVTEFLENGILKKEGGIITLADAFALYNRARGVDLISPEDLLKACECFETLNLPIQLKRFQSGLLVLQEKEKNDEKMINQLTVWIKKVARGVSPFEIAGQFQWSMGIAYEILKIAEQAGFLCRDQCFEGLYFWENRIIYQ